MSKRTFIVFGLLILVLAVLIPWLAFRSKGDAEERIDNLPGIVERLVSAEIERVARKAFQLARGRRKKVTSVDKSNVLENSQLWRRVVIDVAREFPDIELDHLLVDNCAMQLVLNPRRFDVIRVENLKISNMTASAKGTAGAPGRSVRQKAGLNRRILASCRLRIR